MALTRVSRHIIDEPFNPTTVSATDVTATNINASGIGTVGTLRVTGDLTVEGTTTTLDSILTEVDRLEVSANSTVAAGIITQTGSGDILNLFDGSTEVFSVTDGGKVKIGTETEGDNSADNLTIADSGNSGITIRSGTSNQGSIFFSDATSGSGEYDGFIQYSQNDQWLKFGTATSTRLTITSTGYVGINETTPTNRLHVKETNSNTIVGRLESSVAYAYLSIEDNSTTTGNVRVGAHGNDLVINAGAVQRLRITSDGKVRVPDNGKFVAGDADDLQIYNNGTHSYIDNVTNGALIIRNTSNDVDVVIESDDGSGGLANYFRADGSSGDAILYHYGSHKLNTLSTGINVVGTINADGLDIDDNAYVKVGTGDDLQIYHDGTNSYIKSINRTIYIDQTADNFDIVMRNDDGSGGLSNYIQLDGSEGSVILSHYGNTRIQTTNTGASVTGNLNISGHTYLNDDREIVIGAGQDLKLYHDSATGDSFIKETGSGNLKLVTSTFRVRNAADSEHIIWANEDAEVRLYHDSVKKFETTTTGAKVTGALEVTQEYPSIRPTLDLNFAATKTLDRRITFTRDSIGTYTDEDGLVKYASNNVPRFDHDFDTGESLGLLIEESRTNVAPYGNDMSQYSSVNTTKTANDAVAPDGTTTATKLQHGGGGNNWYLDYGISSINASGAGTYTYSVWVKAPDDQPDDYYGCRIAILTSTGNNTEQVFSLKKTWSRITITKTYASESGTIRIHPIIFRNSPGNTDGGKVVPSYVWVWGSQWEQGSFVTSYIPTSGSSVTRGQDSAKITGTNLTDFYNQPEGTIFADYKVIQSDPDIFYLSNGQSSRRIGLYEAGSSQTRFLIGNSGTVADTTDSSGTTVGDNIKSAGAYKLNDIVAAKNGVISSTDSSATIPDGIDRAYIGGYYEGTAEGVLGLRRLSYYNKRLPNAQLQGLTQQ